MVQEGAGLALLLGAADSRRRGLVQEVTDSSFHEHYSSPKLGSAHASVSNLDAQLRSLAAAGAGAPHASSYPAYYSSYYHYYYGYPVSDSLQQQQQHDQQQQQQDQSHTSTSVADHTEHGMNHVETPVVTVSSSFNSSFGIQSVEANASSTEFDLGVSSGSSNGSANPANQPDHQEQSVEGDFSSSPNAGEYELMSQQCSMTNSTIKNTLGEYSNVFENSQTENSNSHLPYNSQTYPPIPNFPIDSGFPTDHRVVTLTSFSESNQNTREAESTSDNEPDSSLMREGP